MNVFWAWQADTPGQIGRFFVRDALTAAIQQLKGELVEVVEPTEREILEDMDIDHDRKGVSGSPDLARTILEKIEAAAVFVADVTPVGIVPPTGDKKADDRPKRLINSNVAIEMGYALRTLSDRSLLMVMNTHYGDRADLPFDVAHKAGPFMYDLAPDVNKTTIAAASKVLQGQFVEALRLCVKDQVTELKAQTPFEAAQPRWKRALFFPNSAVIATAGNPGEQEFQFGHDRVVYLRIHPVSGATEVGRAKVANIFAERRPMILGGSPYGGFLARNDYGSIWIEFAGRTQVYSLTQGFKTGELWGATAQLFQPFASPSTGQALTILPMVTFEKMYCRVLRNYIKVQQALGLALPFTVIMGATGLKDVYITVPVGPLNTGSFHGPIPEDEIERTYTLATDDDAAIDNLLRKFFGQIYDLATISRTDAWTDQLTAAHAVPSR